jgi:hypothetical protein
MHCPALVPVVPPDLAIKTNGIEGLFNSLIRCIRWMTAAFGVLTAILLIIARRVEPAKPVPQ